MHIRAPAIVCSVRQHGETGAIVRLLSADHGMIGAFVAGARGRTLRPVLIPGNLVDAELRARGDSQLPSARVELMQSRGPWLAEPLPAAAIAWVTALAAIALPERHPYPAIHEALSGLLDAICLAPSARGWTAALLDYEVLLLRELGYGERAGRVRAEDWPSLMRAFDLLGRRLERYPLAQRRSDVMAARGLLRQRLARIEGVD